MASVAVRLFCIFVLALLAACKPQPAHVPTACVTPQEGGPLSTIEQDALARSRKKQARSCSRQGMQCYYKVSTNPSHEIVVATGFVYRSPDSGRCLYPAGGFTDVYNADGTFVHTITTL